MCRSVARADSGHDKDAFFVLARARSSWEENVIVGPGGTRWMIVRIVRVRDKKDKLRQGKLASRKAKVNAQILQAETARREKRVVAQGRSGAQDRWSFVLSGRA